MSAFPSPKSVRDALLPTVLVIAVLYFGREFLVPIALSALFAFLLAPVVRRLERWRCGRVFSVVLTTGVAFLLIGAVAYIVVGQLIDLARDLPQYKGHLQEKVMAIKGPNDGPVARARQTLQELTKAVTSQEPAPQGTATPSSSRNAQGQPVPLPVTVVSLPVTAEQAQDPSNTFQTLEKVIAPMLHPLGTAALVVVFVIFILLDREDLRDRFVHLLGRAHLQLTTEAMDDAAHRVSRYLLAQTLVNVIYGIPIGVGLSLLHVPNAVLWGFLAIVLRYIPYLGPWIAAGFPILLSLAVASGWTLPLLTIGLFLVVELLTSNVVEPWLYGASTGLSTMAVITAAAFWTWLWGLQGLLLSTPLTVCVAVLGKYVPGLAFLDVLLGDRPPIAAEDRFYQRLLAGDTDEIAALAEQYRAEHTLPETFDGLFVPAIRLADEDFHAGTLPQEARDRVYHHVAELVEVMAEELPATGAAVEGVRADVLAIPAGDLGDEVVAKMLCLLLTGHGVPVQVISATLLTSEMLAEAARSTPRLLCVSVLPPGSTRHGLYTIKRLQKHFPEARVVAGLWGEPEEDRAGRLRRTRQVLPHGVVTSLQEVLKELLATVEVAGRGSPVPPPPAAA